MFVKQPLNARHTAIVSFIRQYRKTHGYSPSMAEIGAAVGISSKSLVANYLDRLEEEGLVKREPMIARSVVEVE